MTRLLSAIVVGLLLMPAMALAEPASAALPEAPLDAVPDLGRADRLLDDPLERDEDRLIVGHGAERPGHLDAALARVDGEVVRTDTPLGFTVVRVPSALVDTFTRTLAHDPEVRYVTQDGEVQAYYVPDDPHYPQQWGPPTIGVETVWNTTFGDPSLEVAVIDTGVDYTHPDLADNVCRFGPDYVNGDDDPMDDHYHGTHVAGTVAASIDNGEGVAGMADACVVPIKVLSQYGSGQWSDLASALRWSADNDIEIVSMSLGGCAGCDPGEPVTSAIQYAAAAGVLIIAAAGNAHCNAVGYPAAYPEVIAVASTRAPGDEISSFSSCGPEVEVSAPGEDVISTMPLDVEPSGYASLSGTSMAAPHASGVAALFWSQHPNMTAEEVRCVLAQRSNDLLEVGRDIKSGFGRIDAAGMFLDATCNPLPPEIPDIQGRSGDLSAALQWTTPFAWGGVTGYNLYRGTSAEDLVFLADVGAANTHIDTDVTEGSTYHYAIEAYNDAGTGNRSAPITVTVRAALDVPQTLDFEDGFGNWTATGLWHTTTDRSSSGQSAYFGQENGDGLEDNHYDTGEAERGTIESPAIRLPDEATHLSFWQYFELEIWTREHPIVEVATESDPFTYEEVWSMGAYTPYEGPGAVDLTAYAGEVVYLRFVVDTLNSWWNEQEGWYLDDVAIETGPAPQLPPSTTIVVPEADGLFPAHYYAAGPYTDGNGDQDVVNVTLQIDGGAAVGLPPLDHYWFTEYTNLTTGTHQMKASVRDSTGIETNHTVVFHVDAEPPSPGITSPEVGASVGCTLSMQGTATDTGGAGLAWLYLSIAEPDEATSEDHSRYVSFDGETEADWSATLDLTVLPQGAFVAMVTTADRAGNRNVTDHPLQRNDQDCRPQIHLDTPQDGATISCAVAITGTVTSPVGRNLSWVSAYIDGTSVGSDGLWDNDSFDIHAATGHLAEGIHALRLVAYDEEWAWNETVVQVMRDSTDCLPQATITSPDAGTVVDCTFVVSGTASSPREDTGLYIDLRFGEYRWAGSAQVEPDGTWSTLARSGILDAGVHELLAIVSDSDGNRNVSAALTLERSTMDCRPTVSITSPDPGTSATCRLTVSGTASGREGAHIHWVQLVADGRHWVGWTWVDGTTWTIEARTGDLAAGTHTLTAVARDEHGAMNESAPLEIEVLETQCRPVVTVDTPGPGSIVSGNVAIEGTVTHPENASVVVEAWAGHDYLGSQPTPSGTWAFTWNTYDVPNGTYYIDVYAYASNGFSDGIWFQVEVENVPDPRVETESFAGTLGCSGGLLMIQTADLCDQQGGHQSSVVPGLTHGRATLSWDGDDPAGLDRLQLGLTIGADQWVARAGPGDDEIVVEFTLDKTLGRTLPVYLDVRAAGDDALPSLVMDEGYTLDVAWGYYDAPLP